MPEFEGGAPLPPQKEISNEQIEAVERDIVEVQDGSENCGLVLYGLKKTRHSGEAVSTVLEQHDVNLSQVAEEMSQRIENARLPYDESRSQKIPFGNLELFVVFNLSERKRYPDDSMAGFEAIALAKPKAKEK